MGIYLFNLFSIPLYALFIRSVHICNKKKKELLCWISGIQLFLTSALRSTSVGTDLQNYIPAFKNIGNLSWGEVFTYPWEWGYVLLNKIVYTLSPNEHWLLVVIALETVVGYVYFVYKYSNSCWLSLFLFIALGYYCSSFSMLRQSIAIICVLNSIRYVLNTNYKKFFCWIIISMCFHATAISLVLLYPLIRFRVTLNYLIIFLMLSLAFSIFAGKIVLLSLIENYYSIYEGKVVSGEGYGMLILLLLITFVGVWIKTKLHIEDKTVNVFSHLMVIACGLQLFSLQFSLFARIVLYYQLAQKDNCHRYRQIERVSQRDRQFHNSYRRPQPCKSACSYQQPW